MTAQVSEILFYKGEEFQIQCEPLTDYLRNNGKSFESTNTGCWRGYIGTWKIENNKLFLIDILGNSSNGDVGINYLFPNQEEVFANWFSGEIKVPHGKMIEYHHRGHFSVYEEDVLFTFNFGILTKQTLRNNKTGQISNVSFVEIFDKKIKEKINTSSIIQLIDMFNISIRSFPNLNYDECRKINLDESNKLYFKVDLKNWSAAEKEKIFICILKGLNIYYYVVSDMKSMPIGGFNSLMNAINGENFVFVNKKSVKWFSSEIKNKLRGEGIEFEDFQPKFNSYQSSSNYDYDYYSNNWLSEAAGTSDPEIMNDVYWNLD